MLSTLHPGGDSHKIGKAVTLALDLIFVTVLICSGACGHKSQPDHGSAGPGNAMQQLQPPHPIGTKGDHTSASSSTPEAPQDGVAARENPIEEVVSGDSLDLKLKSEEERERRAAAVLRKVLADFPVNCIKAEATIDLAAARRDSDKTVVSLDVRLSADEEKFEAFRKGFQNVLRQLAKETWDEVWNFEDVVSDREGGKPVYRLSHADTGDEAKHKRIAESGQILIGLNTRRSSDWNRLHWDVYALDGVLGSVFGEERLCEYKLSAIWADGSSGLLDVFTINGSLITSPSLGEVYFSPTFLSFCGPAREHIPEATISRQVDLSENEVKRLRKVKCDVRLCAGASDFAGTQKDFMDLGEEIRKLEPPPNASLEDTRVLWMRKVKLSQEMLRRAERNPATRENLRKSLEPLMRMLERAKSETREPP